MRRDSRRMVLAHLAAYPGLTATEIGRAIFGRQDGATIALCRRMERDGQVASSTEYRAQQGRTVTIWRVPDHSSSGRGSAT